MTTHTAPEPGAEPHPVSRIEIVEHVGPAFEFAPQTREDLIALAEKTEARPEVIDALGSLPGLRRFYRPQDLWVELPRLPIEI